MLTTPSIEPASSSWTKAKPLTFLPLAYDTHIRVLLLCTLRLVIPSTTRINQLRRERRNWKKSKRQFFWYNVSSFVVYISLKLVDFEFNVNGVQINLRMWICGWNLQFNMQIKRIEFSCNTSDQWTKSVIFQVITATPRNCFREDQPSFLLSSCFSKYVGVTVDFFPNEFSWFPLRHSNSQSIN